LYIHHRLCCCMIRLCISPFDSQYRLYSLWTLMDWAVQVYRRTLLFSQDFHKVCCCLCCSIDTLKQSSYDAIVPFLKRKSHQYQGYHPSNRFEPLSWNNEWYLAISRNLNKNASETRGDKPQVQCMNLVSFSPSQHQHLEALLFRPCRRTSSPSPKLRNSSISPKTCLNDHVLQRSCLRPNSQDSQTD
jgi:hypothetical protein